MVSNNNGSILILGVLKKNTISTPKTKSHLYFVAQKKKSLILGLKRKKKKKKRSYSCYFFSHHSTTYHTSYHRKKKKKTTVTIINPNQTQPSLWSTKSTETKKEKSQTIRDQPNQPEPITTMIEQINTKTHEPKGKSTMTHESFDTIMRVVIVAKEMTEFQGERQRAKRETREKLINKK